MRVTGLLAALVVTWSGDALAQAMTVEPGQHTVEAKGSTLAWGMPPKSVMVELGPNETQFLRLYVEPGVFQDNVVFEATDAETSLAALQSLRLSN